MIYVSTKKQKLLKMTSNDKKKSHYSLLCAAVRSAPSKWILEDIFFGFIVCKVSGNGVEMSEM